MNFDPNKKKYITEIYLNPQRFLYKFLIIKSNFSMKFSATVSNATLFGLPDFLNKHSADLVQFNLLVDPGYLAPNILDDNSKQIIVEKLQKLIKTDRKLI